MSRIFLKLQKKGNSFNTFKNEDSVKYREFIDSLPQDTIVECYFSVETVADASLGQLAKVHAMIKEIADETGNSSEDVKNDIKRKAELFVVRESGIAEYKSFKNCSKAELSKAIECCIELQNFLGFKEVT